MLKYATGRPALFLAATGLIVFVIIVYWNGLTGPLVLDDPLRLSGLRERIASGTSTLYQLLFSDAGMTGRPISMLTFIANFELTGDSAYSLKVTNVALHILAGIGVFLFVRQVLVNLYTGMTAVRAGWWALAAASLWLLHPIQVSTVLYTIQRMAVLSALFMFYGMYCYTLGRQKQLAMRGGNFLVCVAFVVFTPLAVLSKENGALLPLMLLLIEYFVFGFRGTANHLKVLRTLFILFLFIPLGIGIIYLFVGFEGEPKINYEYRPYDMWERLMTEARVVTLYISQLLWPLNSRLLFFYDDYEYSRSLVEPLTTLASIVFIAGCVIIAWLYRHKARLISLGVLLFLAGHLLESTVLQLILVFEHRNYMPILGIAMIVIGVLIKVRSQGLWSVIVIVCITLLLGITTYTRATIWSSENNLYNFIYRYNPDSPLIVAIAAEALSRQEKYDRALEVLGRVDGIAVSLQTLYVRCLRGDEISSEILVKHADSMTGPLNSHAITAILELADLGLDDSCNLEPDGMLYLLDMAQSRPMVGGGKSKQKILTYKAHYLYLKLNKKEEAIKVLTNAYEAETRSPLPLFLAIEWLIEMGEQNKARSIYESVLKGLNGREEYYRMYTDKIEQKLHEY